MPPKKRARTDQGSSGQQQTEEEEREREAEASLLRDRRSAVVEASVENVRKRAEEERARLLIEATEAAERVTREAKEAAARVMQEATDAAGQLIADEFKAAKAEAAEKSREAREEREALEQEKTAMEKAHTFQKNKIILNVGGQRFETSRQTLTSVPDTYLASMFSGRFELSPDVDDGSYFIDRDPRHFSLVLNYLRDSGSSNNTNAIAGAMEEQQVKELKTELTFFGLLDRMLPYFDEDQIGRDLLRRACSGTGRRKHDIQTAVAQARSLVFTIGSTTPFLTEKYQDLRFVIIDRVVNGSPVWAAVDGDTFMFRDEDGGMWISDVEDCAEGLSQGVIYNDTRKVSEHVLAPTELPSDRWRSNSVATLEAQYASAYRWYPDASGDLIWASVPEMRVNAVYGLDDDDPAMAAALKQLANALPQ